jgi:large subunit ribosomal protein L29
MKVAELITQLREQSVEDLKQRMTDLEEQVFRTRLQKALGQTEQANKLKPMRRELARIQTILREKGVR